MADSSSESLFASKKTRILFALSSGIVFLVLIYLIELMGIPGLATLVSPFSFLLDGFGRGSPFSGWDLAQRFGALIPYGAIATLALYLALGRLSRNNLKTIYWAVLSRYFLVLAPLMVISILFGVFLLLNTGGIGEEALGAAVLIFWPLLAVITALPIMGWAALMHLWLSGRWRHAVAIAVMLAGVLFYLDFGAFIRLGCHPRDSYCLARRALWKQDIGSCDHAKDSVQCLATLSHETPRASPAICERMEQYLAESMRGETRLDQCWQNVALKNRDVSLCKRLSCAYSSGAGCQARCRNSIYYDLAFVEKSVGYCDQIVPDETYARDATGDTQRLRCYARVAIRAQSPRVCDSLGGTVGVSSKSASALCRWFAEDPMGRACADAGVRAPREGAINCESERRQFLGIQ